MKKIISFIIVLISVFNVSFAQINIPNPTSEFFVNDFADVIDDEVEEDLALPIKGGRITTTIADEEILIDGSILSQVTIFNESENEIHVTINFGEEIPLEVEESLSLGDIKIYSIIITESKSTIKYIGY